MQKFLKILYWFSCVWLILCLVIFLVAVVIVVVHAVFIQPAIVLILITGVAVAVWIFAPEFLE
jgi:hypothetical protein